MRLFFFPVALLILVSATGCQQATMVRGGEPVTVADGAYTVLPWGNWTSTEVENEERWTQHGPLLDRMVFYDPVGDGETLFVAKPGDEENDGPEFYAEMSMLDIGEFVIGSLAFRDLQDVRTGQFSAAKFGSQPGFHLEITAYTKNGLKMEGFARGIIHDGKLYLVTFLAPSLHYHAAVRQDAEFLADSIWPEWEEGDRPQQVRRKTKPQSAAATRAAPSTPPTPKKAKTPPAPSVGPKPSEAAPSEAAQSAATTLAAAPTAKTSRASEEQAPSQVTEMLQFESKLARSKAQLIPILNRYNRDVEFKTSSHQPGTLLKIEDVSRVTVMGPGGDGYVVRIVGNSGIAASWSKEVYDETFLIREQYGIYQILGHGQGIAPESNFYAFEDRLRGSKDQLVALLNSYNRDNEFSLSQHSGRRLTITDVSKLWVVDERDQGYVVRIVGNSTIASSRSSEVYDETFLIQERNGTYRILDHGQALAPREPTLTASQSRPGERTKKLVRGSELYVFEERLKVSKGRLLGQLNKYNRENKFAVSPDRAARLDIKEVTRLRVLSSRSDGYVVQIIGKAGLAESSSDRVYDEYFVIEEREDTFHIVARLQ